MKKFIYLALLLPLVVAMKCEKEEPQKETPNADATIVDSWSVTQVRMQVLENGNSIYDTLAVAPFANDLEVASAIVFETDSLHMTLNQDNSVVTFKYAYANNVVSISEEGESLELFTNVSVQSTQLSFDVSEPIVDQSNRIRLYSYQAERN